MRLFQVVTCPVIAVTQSAVTAVAPLLEQLACHQISHLPVVDHHNRLLGLIHQSRLLHVLLQASLSSPSLSQLGSRFFPLQPHQRAQLFQKLRCKFISRCSSPTFYKPPLMQYSASSMLIEC
ncbi:MAG: CBS domain-containing protein [Phormidesmis sp. RL_2_1]|nr:CBS domain-containing protein [Phormidesmis sp. RL_2_1]